MKKPPKESKGRQHLTIDMRGQCVKVTLLSGGLLMIDVHATADRIKHLGQITQIRVPGALVERLRDVCPRTGLRFDNCVSCTDVPRCRTQKEAA